MRLYICADGSYVGTQAEAKAKGKGWMLEEVPTDKEGLIEYLNANRHLHELECPEPNIHAKAPESLVQHDEPDPAPEQARPEPKPAVALVRSSYEATDIEDFILNRASIDQVGNILSRIGTRFAELIKDRGLTGLLD